MCAGGGARNVSIVVTAHNDSSSFLFKKHFRSRNYIRYIHNDSFLSLKLSNPGHKMKR